ncbi:MAG: acylphosphatase [Gemmatimonadota bacterium]|nr:acylphosphatase [Gemmatimonadota bacterium]
MTRRWLVSGRVQGVGFRYFVLREAAGRGLRGWTRNLPDGQVEVVAAGDAASLDGLRSALQRGPRHAEVMGVEETQISDELGDLKSFDIR